MKPRRAWILVLVGFGFAAGLLYLTVRRVELGAIWAEIGEVSIGLLLLLPCIKLITFLLGAVRTRVLFAPLHRFSVYRLFKSMLLAFAVNNVVPMRAGEIARVGYLARYGGLPASTCLAVVATERVLDLFVLVTIFACVLPGAAIDLPVSQSLYVAGAVAVCAFGAALLVSRSPERFTRLCTTLSGIFGATIRGHVERQATTFARGLSALESLRAVFGILALSAAYWALSTLGLQVLIIAFGIELPWYAPVVVLAFLSLGLAVPATPGHVGTYHFFTYSAMTTLGVEATRATSFAIVGHVVAIIPFTVVGAILLFGDFIGKRPEAPDADETTPG